MELCSRWNMRDIKLESLSTFRSDEPVIILIAAVCCAIVGWNSW